MNPLIKLINDINAKGIPLPLFRDIKTNLPSISLTMMVLSFSVYFIGLISKLTKFTGDINLNEAQNLLVITSGLYFMRTVSSGNTTSAPPTTNKETP
jgi:hypothetical protein